MDLERRLQRVQTIAREAGAIATSHQAKRSELIVDAKGPQDWVTAADRDVERLIRGRLEKAFPTDGFVGEESGGEIAESIWVVDPIDGTTNFLRGLPEYAVSIAFVTGGQTELGVIYAPALDKLYVAQRGQGAFCNGERLAVAATSSMTEAVVTVGYGASQSRSDFVSRVEAILGAGAAFRRFGSATIGLSAVAAGHVDAFWQQHLSAWDVLAGLLMVREAGGVTNDFLANDGMTRGNPTLATTPALQKQLSELTGVVIDP